MHFYYSISKPARSEIKIKGSRFIGLCFPVSNSEQCAQILSEQQRTYHDANHVCCGYQVGVGDSAVYRSSDAGEPAGTAGAPILNVIRGENLTNIIVIIVRYFGGTKLGIGGLVKAYTESAKNTLERSKRIRFEILSTIRFQIDFNFLDPTMRIMTKFNAKVIEQKYENEVELSISVPVSNKTNLIEKLIDISKGKIKILSENA